MGEQLLPMEAVPEVRATPGRTAVCAHGPDHGRVYTDEETVLGWTLSHVPKAQLLHQTLAGTVVSFPLKHLAEVRAALFGAAEREALVGTGI